MLKRRELRLLLTSLAAMLMLFDTAGSSHSAEERGPIESSPILRRHERVRKLTSLNFRQAAFVSPAPDSKANIPLTMAPLIVQELPDDPADIERSFVRFGAVEITSMGLAAVRQDRQTVYLLRSKVRLAEEQRDRLTFVWFYPSDSLNSELRHRGVCITLGNRGFPMTWQLLSSESRLQKIYVSKPLERAAFKRYHSPLPGRRFAVEPPLKDQPQVVVPRALSEGPIAMGPFVYLNARNLRITTLICRCEPSQVAAFPDSSHYQLQEIQNWSDLYSGKCPPANLALPTVPVDLASMLRLPKGS